MQLPVARLLVMDLMIRAEDRSLRLLCMAMLLSRQPGHWAVHVLFPSVAPVQQLGMPCLCGSVLYSTAPIMAVKGVTMLCAHAYECLPKQTNLCGY